jgi:hypothetical protein
MSPRSRRTLVVVVTLALLALLAVWSLTWMLHNRSGAQAARGEADLCEQVGREIEALRGKSTMASSEASGVKEVGERIETAKGQAGLPEAAIKGVYPQQAHALGDTPYLQKATSLELAGVSLPQLTSFLYYVTDGSGLSVRDLRLRSPRSDSSDGLWDVELTLTYLIYDPSAARGDDR